MKKNDEKLKRFAVEGMPLINSVAQRINLRTIFSKYIAPYGNEKIPVVDTLMILLCNITGGRKPLYQLEQWAQRIEPRCFQLKQEKLLHLNDDRFARALDKLYLSDRASLMTEIVVKMIKAVNLDIDRIHNDSTTVKAYGKIPGKTITGLELLRGNSKDHRPDLKQLVFSLTISADGAVPIHYKTYPGNRTDDTTHIETWDTICRITGKRDFLYVADCKLCTKKQLAHIVGEGGRAITIVPESWKACHTFKEELRCSYGSDSNKPLKRKRKRVIWRREISEQSGQYENFSLFSGDFRASQAGYRIFWYHSSEKEKKDRLRREQKLQKAESKLLNLIPRLNKRKFKTKEAIERELDSLLKKYGVKSFFEIALSETKIESRVQAGRGRPGPNTKYKTYSQTHYSLFWKKDKEALKQEKKVDGIFPLLTTDDSLSAKSVLLSYKYQPRLEKRFTQFKSVHEAAPLLFKKIERVEAIMFLFFLSLMIQAIIEREVRLKMKEEGIETLPIYPEDRDAYHPTTSKILDTFDGISSYQVTIEGKTKKFRDSLTQTQETILSLLNIDINDFWGK
ncbi:MAG: IS1634 family transposase [Candidatus Omnitrophica bacterium]|nr:IS1634 family transposase [Candidatus Omnitrophota bacterium]